MRTFDRLALLTRRDMGGKDPQKMDSRWYIATKMPPAKKLDASQNGGKKAASEKLPRRLLAASHRDPQLSNRKKSGTSMPKKSSNGGNGKSAPLAKVLEPLELPQPLEAPDQVEGPSHEALAAENQALRSALQEANATVVDLSQTILALKRQIHAALRAVEDDGAADLEVLAADAADAFMEEVEEPFETSDGLAKSCALQDQVTDKLVGRRSYCNEVSTPERQRRGGLSREAGTSPTPDGSFVARRRSSFRTSKAGEDTPMKKRDNVAGESSASILAGRRGSEIVNPVHPKSPDDSSFLQKILAGMCFPLCT